MLRWSSSVVRLRGGDDVAWRKLIHNIRIRSSGSHSSHGKSSVHGVLHTTRRSLCVVNVAPLSAPRVSASAAGLPRPARNLLSVLSSSSQPVQTKSSPNPISVLRQFLSYDLQSPESLHTHTPNTLRSLYLSSRSQNRLLTPSQLSNLISLFGSLLTNSHHILRPLLRNVKIQSSRTYWGFILRLIRDKQNLGHELSSADHYWMMRSHLSRLDEKGGSSVASADRELSKAKIPYHHLRHNSQLFDAHACYAAALLAHGSPGCLPELVAAVCNMITTQAKLDDHQVSLLWKTVLAPGFALPPQSRARILGALRGRFEMVQSGLKNHAAQDPVLEGEPTVSDLVSLLESTIFPLTPNSPSFSSLVPWATRETRSALFSAPENHASGVGWRNACVLALVRSPSGNAHLSGTDDKNNAVDWRILCILTILDKHFGAVDPPREILEAVINVLNPVWSLWTTSDCSHRPIAVDRAIAAAILRLAGALRDRSLQLNCRQYCLSRGFWFHPYSPLLAVEYAITSVACGERDWKSIFPGLDEHPSKVRVVEETISRCVMKHPESAHELHTSSALHSIKVSSNTTVIVAQAISRVRPELVISYLSNQSLSPNQLKQILKVLLLSSVGLWTIKRSQERLLIIGEAMLYAFSDSSPPMHLRGRIEIILLLMLRMSGQTASTGLQLMRVIHHNSTGFLRTKFMTSALRCLIAHRFFRAALRFLCFHASLHIDEAQRWQGMLVRGLMRGNACTLAHRASRTCFSPLSHRTSFQSSAWTLGLNLRQPNHFASLKISRKIRKDSDIGTPELASAIMLLVSTRRIRAAKTIYAGTRYKVGAVSRTSMGNTILHASLTDPRRQNAQRVRTLLRTLQELMRDYGLVPDRITVNILFKGILMWDEAINSQRLRGLFNYLISNGYPGGVRDENGSVVKPFNTNTSSISHVVPLANISEDVSFERHARPLYKMFIKAFHLRGDREGAWVVVGILKRVAEEAKRVDH